MTGKGTSLSKDNNVGKNLLFRTITRRPVCPGGLVIRNEVQGLRRIQTY